MLGGMALALLGSREGGRGTSAVTWESVRPGIELGTMSLSAPGEGWRTRVMLLRLDPDMVRLRLGVRLNPDRSAGAWTVDAAPAAAVAAFNAGQFSGIAPWGWTVMDGLELRPPGIGPLSMTVVVDSSGIVRLLPPDSIAPVRQAGGVLTAFSSYPALLVDQGRIPDQLVNPGFGIDVGHRDSRLALGQLPDGMLLLLLTRFDGIGEAGGAIPFGLTLGETATLLRSLGAIQAVALDGGISSQLMVRTAGGDTRAWHAWRKVPVGVVVEAR
jgi:hypothetical protein